MPHHAASNVRCMDPELEIDTARHLQALTQAAVDDTATAYTEDADLDVEAHFREEMEKHGITVADDEWVADLAVNIRSGHPVVVGGHVHGDHE